MMTVEINTPTIKKRMDIPVTTHVVSDYNTKVSDKSSNSDITRTQITGTKKTNPTQFPNGVATIKSSTATPQNYKGKYGDGWLTTDATQSLPAIDRSGDITDRGYYIHYTVNSNTNGCIGVKNLFDMEELLCLYEINNIQDNGKATITVEGEKKNK